MKICFQKDQDAQRPKQAVSSRLTQVAVVDLCGRNASALEGPHKYHRDRTRKTAGSFHDGSTNVWREFPENISG